MVLLLLIIIAIRVPAVQQFVVQQVVSTLSEQTGADISLESVLIKFPKTVALEGLFVEDQQEDTLLYLGRLEVNADIWALLRKKIHISQLTLANTTANLLRKPADSAYNFTFILDSFSSPSGDTTKKEETGDPWKFSIGHISLENIQMKYLDSLTGINLVTDIGDLDVKVNTLDFDTLSFGVDDISLENSDIRMEIYGNATSTTEDLTTSYPEIGVNHIELQNVNFRLNEKTTGLKLETHTGKLVLEVDEFNLEKQIIAVQSLQYLDSEVSINYASQAPADTNSVVAESTFSFPTIGWELSVGELLMQDLTIGLHNTASPDTAAGFDPNHLAFIGFELDAKQLAYIGKMMMADIESLSFEEQHGFMLKKFAAAISASDTATELKNLILITNGSEIRQNATFSYPGLENIADHPATVQTDMQAQIIRLDTADILFFVPGLFDSLPLQTRAFQTLELEAEVSGNLNELMISHFSMSLLDSTKLSLEGSLMGIMDTDSLEMNLEQFNFTTSRSDLHNIINDSLLPSAIAIPPYLNVTAQLNGNRLGFVADATIESSFGTIEINGKADNINSSMPSYQATLSTQQFMTGMLLKDTAAFGPLTVSMEADGKGFDPLTMVAETQINISSFTYNDYRYDSIEINASADAGTYALETVIKDEYIDFELTGSLVYDTMAPVLDLVADLKAINLQQTGLSEDDIRAKGKLTAHLKGNSLNDLNGKIETRDILVIKGDELFPVDSLIFVSINDTAKTELSIQSDFLSANYTGTIKPEKLVTSLKDHFSHYFFIDGDTISTPGDASFEFNINIKSSALLTRLLVPGLEELDPGQITGQYKGSEQKLKVEANLPLVSYKGNEIKNFTASVSSNTQQMDVGMNIGIISLYGYFISDVSLQTMVSDNKAKGTFKMEEKEEQAAYNIPFQLRRADSALLLSFTGNDIVLNSKTWQLNNDDEMKLSDLASGTFNIGLLSGDEKLRLKGTGNTFSATLQNFRLSNFGNILNTSDGTILIQGLVNGEFILEQGDRFDTLTADFKIGDFNILEQPLGDVQVNLYRKNQGYMNGELVVSGNNDIRLTMSKIPVDTGQNIEATLTLDRFNLQTLNGFMPGQSDSLHGWIGGELAVGNTLQKPELNGEITFNEANTFLKSYGTYIGADDQKIKISDNDIVFQGFTLHDKKNGNMNLKGRIINTNFSSFEFDMQIQATDFMAIDKTKKGKAPYHGQLVFSTDTRLNGTSENLVIDGRLTINEETNFSLNMLTSDPTSTSYEGVVEFVDKDGVLNPILIDTTNRQVAFISQGVIVSANVEIEKKAVLEMVVDERAGDKLWVQGSGNLTFSIDETGLPSLSGRYNLNDGGYNLTLFDITQREFKIKNSSFVVWSGEPMEARLNIDATYQVNTSAYNLIVDQTKNTSGDDLKRYRQNLPFIVNLMIRGEINSPIINFSIELPADKRGVYNGVVQAKLNQLEAPGNESSLNKQVLSLLAFRQFMPQNPLDIGSGSAGLGSTARTSVSKVLSSQLNAFSEKYIKGFNVNFDVQSYEQYSEEGSVDNRTELGVGVSKSFFSNRLSVSVGSSIELESEKYRTYNSFNDIAENIAVEYKLTENGVYRLKAFRYTDYEQFEGDVTKSGVSLIFNKDFNWLRNIFLKTDSIPDRKLRKQEANEE